MQCSDFREVADSYLSDELLIETMHQVNRHLESCAACRSDLSMRRRLRERLRGEFTESVDLRPGDDFGDRLRLRLQQQALDRSRVAIPRFAYVGIAAMLLMTLGVGLLGVRSWRSGRRESGAWTNLVKSATGDHRACALEHRLGATNVDLNEAARVYDRAYAALADQTILNASLPAGAQLVDAHSCAFEGRRFAHLVISYHDQVLSIVVTGNEPNSRAPQPLPGDVVAGFSAGAYQVAALQTRHHAIFVVSSLSETDNMAVARQLAPMLQKQLSSGEQPLEAMLFNARR